MIPDGFITLEVASARYGIRVGTIRRWIDKKWLERHFFPNIPLVFINEKKLLELLEERRKDPRSKLRLDDTLS